MNRFDKPHRVLPNYDTKKGIELFNIISRLDTHELLQYSLTNQVPLDVANDIDENLVHDVVNMSPKKATQHNKLSVIKFLVNNGVNPDKPNKFNQTPLHFACTQQLEHVIEYLLSIGCNANYPDNMGLTPFHYLLTGDIKTIENLHDIMDFVPPPKDVVVDKKKDLIEIKKLLWTLVQTETEEKTNFPLLKTLEKTIGNITLQDKELVARQLELTSRLTSLLSQSNMKPDSGAIKELILASKNQFTQIIKRKLGGLNNLSDLTIHQTVPELSWSPIGNGPFSLIRNGNIKKVIKTEMRNLTTDIINSSRQLTVFENPGENMEDDGFSDIVHDIIVSLPLTRRGGGNYVLDQRRYDGQQILEHFNENVNDKYRHQLAVDNASDIIDFDNMFLVSGPRKIVVELNNLNAITSQNIWTEMNRLLAIPNENQLILDCLGTPVNINAIDELTPANLHRFNTEILTLNRWINIPSINVYIGAGPDQIIVANNVYCYIILAYYAIQKPHEFNSIPINYPPFFQRVPATGVGEFGMKWYNIYMKGNINLSSWLYSMWCDLICKFSVDNLEGKIYFKTLMLIAGLNSYSTNKTQGIANAFKPHLLQHIYNQLNTRTNNGVILGNMFMTLLNDNITTVFLGQMLTMVDINTLPISPELKNLGKLLYRYGQNKDTFVTTDNSEESKYFNKFKTNDNNISTFTKIILNLYDNMMNKPMKQTILDYIFILNEFDKTNTINVNMVNIVNILRNPININENLCPSCYSIQNRENPNEDHKIIISHLLGLSYIGNLNNLNTNTYIYNNILIGNRDVWLFSPNGHRMNGNDLNDNEIPLPLNFLKLDPTLGLPNILTYNAKHNYYNIDNHDFNIPTKINYFLFLVKKIRLLQTKISELLNNNGVNSIISDLLKGNSMRLKDLYTEIYLKLVNYSRHLLFFINQFNSYRNTLNESVYNDIKNKFKNPVNYNYIELANRLNKINSNYYLYYYLFAPQKLIKLNKFNFYQIPTSTPDSYQYFNNNAEMPNIIGDDYRDITYLINAGDIESKEERKEGMINMFSLNNYNGILQDYKNNILPTRINLKNEEFKILKTSSLPPSLEQSLDLFYQYTLKTLIENILGKITPEIDNKVTELIKNIGITIGEYDLSKYDLLAKTIQDLLIDQINVYIDNKTNEIYNKKLSGIVGKQPVSSTILSSTPKSINLTNTKVELDKIIKSTTNNYTNLYPLMAKIEKPDVFIIYPNDFTNLNRLKSKYGISKIKKEAINNLLKYNGSPFIHNLDGNSSIYPIIMNLNYDTIKDLKQLGIDFRTFEKEQPLYFITEQIKRELNKVMGTYEGITPMKNIFNNICSYLYSDIKSMIQANEAFGNNILNHLEDSFYMSTYLTLQFLSEHLLDTDTQFSITDLKDLVYDDKYIKEIHSNYLFTNIKSLNIMSDFNDMIKLELKEQIAREITELINDKSNMDKTIKQLKNDNNMLLAKKIEDSDKYTKTNEKIGSLTSKFFGIGIIFNNKLTKIDSKDMNTTHIIDRYDTDIHNGVILKGWSALFNQPYVYNCNLIPLQLLKKQNEIMKDFNLSPNLIEDIKKINKGFNHFSRLGETYFNTDKYTDTNKFLKFIEDMLIYICRMVFGTSIEYMMRRILFVHFQDTIENTDEIIDRIELIINGENIGQTKSMRVILLDEVCPEMVKSSAEIFKSRAHEKGEPLIPIRDILSNYFRLLEKSQIKIDREIVDVFRRYVVPYLDTFVSKSILLWYVNCENILKYFINIYRNNQTLINLIE